MSRNWTFARGRASLLATSMFATTALAGLGGMVGTVVLSPGVALAAECTPAPDAGTGGALTTTTNLVEDCGPAFGNTYGDGLGYTAGNTSLTVILSGAGTITSHSVEIDGNGTAQNLSLLVDTTAAAGPSIVTTGDAGIFMDDPGGGNIVISTGNTTSGVGNNIGSGFPANANFSVFNSATPHAGSVIDGGTTGIFAATTGAGSVMINAAGNVTGETGDGIQVFSQAGDVNILVSGNGTSQIQSNSLGVSAGLSVTTTTGNVTIITDQGDSIGSTHGDGIDVTSTSGNIFVHLLDGAINANTSGLGPSGCSNCSAPGINLSTGGNATINIITDDNVNNKGPGDGIDTRTVNGNNTVTVDAQVNNTKGNGVLDLVSGNGVAEVILGNVTTESGNTTTVTPYVVDTTGGTSANVGVGAINTAATGNQTAIVLSTDPGNVTIANATGGSFGILASVGSSGAGGTATVNMVGASGGLVSVQGTKNLDTGIEARDGSGTASVTTNNGRTILVGQLGGNFDQGVVAIGTVAKVALGASNTIKVGNGAANTTSVFEFGVRAVGSTVASVTAGNGTSVTVSGVNDLFGILARSNGSTNVTLGNTVANTTGITVTGNATTGNATFGILAIATGNATVGVANVTVGSTTVKVSGGPRATGIGALATAGVNVTTAGNVTSSGVGIRTISGGNTAINVNGGTTSGLGQVVANVSIPSIQFTNATANTTTTIGIGAAGTVATDLIGNATTPSLTGLAIAPGPGNATIGSVVVNDSGHLIGDVDFSRVVGTGFAGNATLPANISNTTVNVLGNGVWTTSGTDKFGNGALGAGNATVASDTVTTSGAGTINTVANTTFVFGNTTKNTFTNAGITRVGSDGAPSIFTLTGPSIVLANAGLIDLSTGAVGTDSLTGLTTAFVGVAGGQIATKAQLGGIGSIASVLTVATTSGANNIKVIDAGGMPGFVPLSSGGIVLVHTGGAATNTAAFTLDSGSSGFATFGPSAQGLVKGVWLYTLANTGQNEVLVSTAGPGAFEAPIIATAAQDIWYATAPWQDRQADLRDSVLLAPGDLGSFTPGVWIKAVGDWTSRTDKIDPPAGFVFDLDYRQDTYGIIAGIDGATHLGGGVGLIGVAGGYLNSQVNFNSHVGLADQNYDGGTVSVYATYLLDQFFIDGQFKADLLTLAGQRLRRLRLDPRRHLWRPGGSRLPHPDRLRHVGAGGHGGLHQHQHRQHQRARHRRALRQREQLPRRARRPLLGAGDHQRQLHGQAGAGRPGLGRVRRPQQGGADLAGARNAGGGWRQLLRGLRGSRRRARPLQPRRPLLGLPDRVVQVQEQLQRRQGGDRLPLPVGRAAGPAAAAPAASAAASPAAAASAATPAAAGARGQGLRGLLPVRSVRADPGSPAGGATGRGLRQVG